MRKKLLLMTIVGLFSMMVFAGEYITLKFPTKIELSRVFKLIAQQAGVNILISSKVAGTAPSVILNNVYYEEAFNIIAKTYGLSVRKVGNTYIVGKAEDLAKSFDVGLTKMIKLNYADPNKVASVVTQVFKGSGGAAATLKVTASPQNNAIIVSGTKDLIQSVEQLVKKIDTPAKQVLLEVKLIEVNTTLQNELGFKWDWGDSGSLNADTGPNGGKFVTLGEAIQSNAYGMYPAFKFGDFYRTNKFGLDTVFRAMLSEGNTKTITRTKLVLLNGEEGTITYGDKLTYQAGGDQGAQEKDATINLKVKAIINDAGYITLDLEPDFTTLKEWKDNLPILTQKKLKTKIRVKDGEEILLGGFTKEKSAVGYLKVPFLSSLPIIGKFFTHRTKSKETLQWIFLLRPHILNTGED